MEYQTHPLIPPHIFVEIHQKMSAIDSMLNLHYSSHSADPLLVKLLDQAASLASTRIKVSDLECIMNIDPDFYRLYKTGDNYHDYAKIYIRFSRTFTPKMIQTRKQEFYTKLNLWISNNQHSHLQHRTVELILKEAESEARTSRSPSKVTKPKSGSSSPIKRKKSLANDLKNDPCKFQFHQRDEKVQQQQNNGLSLLERIKLKEKLRNQQSVDSEDTPELKYDKYLVGKAASIYDIVYQMTNIDGRSEVSISFSKLIDIIKDSLDYPMNSDEVIDTLKKVESKLGKTDQNYFTILKRSGVTVLKVGVLDRDRDLKLLNN
jgi:hypothetical protein